MAPNQAYGYIVGAGIGKGRIISMDASRARAAPGVLAVITAPETKPVGKSNWNNAPLFGGARWPTTIRPSPAWWQRPSSRPAPPQR